MISLTNKAQLKLMKKRSYASVEEISDLTGQTLTTEAYCDDVPDLDATVLVCPKGDRLRPRYFGIFSARKNIKGDYVISVEQALSRMNADSFNLIFAKPAIQSSERDRLLTLYEKQLRAHEKHANGKGLGVPIPKASPEEIMKAMEELEERPDANYGRCTIISPNMLQQPDKLRLLFETIKLPFNWGRSYFMTPSIYREFLCKNIKWILETMDISIRHYDGRPCVRIKKMHSKIFAGYIHSMCENNRKQVVLSGKEICQVISNTWGIDCRLPEIESLWSVSVIKRTKKKKD
jgi:hypothetical protein